MSIDNLKYFSTKTSTVRDFCENHDISIFYSFTFKEFIKTAIESDNFNIFSFIEIKEVFVHNHEIKNLTIDNKLKFFSKENLFTSFELAVSEACKKLRMDLLISKDNMPPIKTLTSFLKNPVKVKMENLIAQLSDDEYVDSVYGTLLASTELSALHSIQYLECLVKDLFVLNFNNDAFKNPEETKLFDVSKISISNLKFNDFSRFSDVDSLRKFNFLNNFWLFDLNSQNKGVNIETDNENYLYATFFNNGTQDSFFEDSLFIDSNTQIFFSEDDLNKYKDDFKKSLLSSF